MSLDSVLRPGPLPRTGLPRPTLVTETWLVLGVSLGASALWSLLRLVDKVSRQESLSAQTTAMNSSVTPDRPWLDLAYQLLPIALGVLPALLGLHLMRRDDPAASGLLGLDAHRPGRDLLGGAALAAVIGIPGLGLYALARALDLNTTIAAANLSEHWWTIPVLVLAAAQNGILEEVVMVGYLQTRWRQAGWSAAAAITVSAVVRGGYHLYQGFGGFLGNLVMGLVFGAIYCRTRRLWPLVLAHTLLDVVAFVGYTLLKAHWSWL